MRTSQRLWFSAMMHLIVWFWLDLLFVECQETVAVCLILHAPLPTRPMSVETLEMQQPMTLRQSECVSFLQQNGMVKQKENAVKQKRNVVKQGSTYSLEKRKHLENPSFVSGVLMISVVLKKGKDDEKLKDIERECMGATIEASECGSPHEMTAPSLEEKLRQPARSISTILKQMIDGNTSN